jgi:hypothetical protein
MNLVASIRLIAVMSMLMLGSCIHESRLIESIPTNLDYCIRLADIHGLWGGYDLTIQNDGTTYVREVKVERGRREKRFKTKLSVVELAKVKSFIIDVDYFAFREIGRSGLPDEARPHIWASFDGRSLHAAKWANDNDKRFDLVYDHLLNLAVKIAKQRPAWAGKYDASIVWPSFLKTN